MLTLKEWMDDAIHEMYKGICERQMRARQEADERGHQDELQHNLDGFIDVVDSEVAEALFEAMAGTFLVPPDIPQLREKVIAYREDPEHNETNTLVWMTGVFCIQGGPRPNSFDIKTAAEDLYKQAH